MGRGWGHSEEGPGFALRGGGVHGLPQLGLGSREESGLDQSLQAPRRALPGFTLGFHQGTRRPTRGPHPRAVRCQLLPPAGGAGESRLHWGLDVGRRGGCWGRVLWE